MQCSWIRSTCINYNCVIKCSLLSKNLNNICYRILVAINGLTGSAQATAFTNFKAWVDNESRGALPEPFDTVVCDPIGNLTQYLTDLTSNIAKLTLSGDNTKAITNAQTSSDALLKAVGCLE